MILLHIGDALASVLHVCVCAAVSFYLCAGRVLQCDGESAAATALCQHVLARPGLEEHPAVERGHEHVPHHRTLSCEEAETETGF